MPQGFGEFDMTIGDAGSVWDFAGNGSDIYGMADDWMAEASVSNRRRLVHDNHNVYVHLSCLL